MMNDIFEAFLAQCRPYANPREELLATELVSQQASGLAVAIALADPQEVIFPIRCAPHKPPYQLVTTAGVMGSSLPAAVGSAAPLLQGLDADASLPVLAVFSKDDLVAARSVGLRALYAGRLAECDETDHTEFCSFFRLPEFAFPDELAVDPAEPHEVAKLSAGHNSCALHEAWDRGREEQLPAPKDQSFVKSPASSGRRNESDIGCG